MIQPLESPKFLSREEAFFSDLLPRPRPVTPAHIIGDDAEAIAITQQLAESFSQEALLRDRDRRLPFLELDCFSQSGLWGITVPKEYGGAEVSYVTVAEVFATIASADPALAQIAQNHFNDVDTLRWAATDPQKQFFFGEVLRGLRFGNALAEPSSKKNSAFDTRLTSRGDEFVLNGHKIYSTGALLAHWVQVGATDENDNDVLVLVPRDTTGLEVIDDWAGFGQRTTASGTVMLTEVVVPPSNVIQAHQAFTNPTTNGPLSQIIHAAIDLGIARAAVSDTIVFISTLSRPSGDANVERAGDDPFTIVQVGDLEYRLHSAEALMDRAGQFIDEASHSPTDATVAAATIAVAEAKIASTEISILATNKLFELSGTRSTLQKYGLDRHWRNARTHTLHDAVRWKNHQIGNYYVNGIIRRHAWH
ncbi:MAG: SfnB family sulfur acquisition oxidoreductase [Janthinobacterium lividum]